MIKRNHDVGDELQLKVNGTCKVAKVFGYEPIDDGWLYQITIAEYPFSIKVTQRDLVNGVSINTNGITAKVLVDNGKAKAK